MSHLLNEIINNPKTIVTTHTSSQVTSDSGNVSEVLTGSEITYTPTQGSSKVIYEISFYCEKLDGKSFLGFYLEEYASSSWSEIHTKYRRNFGNFGTNSQRWYVHFRFVLPAWTGSKQLRLTLSSNTGGRSLALNQMTEWDGAGSVTDKFCNTNLLVYSI